MILRRSAGMAVITAVFFWFGIHAAPAATASSIAGTYVGLCDVPNSLFQVRVTERGSLTGAMLTTAKKWRFSGVLNSNSAAIVQPKSGGMASFRVRLEYDEASQAFAAFFHSSDTVPA